MSEYKGKLIGVRAFAKMSDAEKRVAIAKDVLLRVELENVMPRQGNFWRSDWNDSSLTPQKAINKGGCSVCAKGAIFCTWVGNFNKIDWSYARYVSERSTSFPEEILEVFPAEMLDNIEAAFEGDNYAWHVNGHLSRKYAVAFRGKASLGEIMEYLVKHGGEFPLPTI
jgi:hypothetical protein